MRRTTHWLTGSASAAILVALWVAPAAMAQAQPGEMGGTDAMGQPMEQVMGRQGGGTMTGTCPMSSMAHMMEGPMGVVLMVLCGLLILAVIAVLIALTVFLLRRSRPSGPR